MTPQESSESITFTVRLPREELDITLTSADIILAWPDGVPYNPVLVADVILDAVWEDVSSVFGDAKQSWIWGLGEASGLKEILENAIKSKVSPHKTPELYEWVESKVSQLGKAVVVVELGQN